MILARGRTVAWSCSSLRVQFLLLHPPFSAFSSASNLREVEAAPCCGSSMQVVAALTRLGVKECAVLLQRRRMTEKRVR